MTPILVPEEIVFDERDGESFGERAPEVAVIDLRRKDRDVGRARTEIIGIGNKEMVEHRCRRDERPEKK